MKRYFLLLFTLLLAFTTFGCGGQQAATSSSSSASSSAAPQELHVSAAASLTDAINELGELYKKDHPNVTITPSYGSSGALEKAIENGAPADVFLSAGKKQMDDLEKAGEIADGTRFDLLKNDLVLIAPSNSDAAKAVKDPDKVTESVSPFQALTNADVRKIAIGGDGVPVGSYSKEALDYLQLTDAVQPKVVYATDVRQVLAWVASGDCDRGLVYATDAKTTKDVTVLAAAPAASHRPVVYPAAVVKSAKEADLAKDFLTFLQSDAAQAVFAKYGFAKP